MGTKRLHCLGYISVYRCGSYIAIWVYVLNEDMGPLWVLYEFMSTLWVNLDYVSNIWVYRWVIYGYIGMGNTSACGSYMGICVWALYECMNAIWVYWRR